MSREIKFRAWDKISGRYAMPGKDKMYITLAGSICSTEEQGDGLERIDGRSYRLILEQFTGLHDSNGREIHEGDILGWKERGNDHRCEVSWCPSGYWNYRMPSNEDGGLLQPILANVDAVIEGNIHENPDLLG